MAQQRLKLQLHKPEHHDRLHLRPLPQSRLVQHGRRLLCAGLDGGLGLRLHGHGHRLQHAGQPPGQGHRPTIKPRQRQPNPLLFHHPGRHRRRGRIPRPRQHGLDQSFLQHHHQLHHGRLALLRTAHRHPGRKRRVQRPLDFQHDLQRPARRRHGRQLPGRDLPLHLHRRGLQRDQRRQHQRRPPGGRLHHLDARAGRAQDRRRLRQRPKSCRALARHDRGLRRQLRRGPERSLGLHLDQAGGQCDQRHDFERQHLRGGTRHADLLRTSDGPEHHQQRLSIHHHVRPKLHQLGARGQPARGIHGRLPDRQRQRDARGHQHHQHQQRRLRRAGLLAEHHHHQRQRPGRGGQDLDRGHVPGKLRHGELLQRDRGQRLRLLLERLQHDNGVLQLGPGHQPRLRSPLPHRRLIQFHPIQLHLRAQWDWRVSLHQLQWQHLHPEHHDRLRLWTHPHQRLVKLSERELHERIHLRRVRRHRLQLQLDQPEHHDWRHHRPLPQQRLVQFN